VPLCLIHSRLELLVSPPTDARKSLAMSTILVREVLKTSRLRGMTVSINDNRVLFGLFGYFFKQAAHYVTNLERQISILFYISLRGCPNIYSTHNLYTSPKCVKTVSCTRRISFAGTRERRVYTKGIITMSLLVRMWRSSFKRGRVMAPALRTSVGTITRWYRKPRRKRRRSLSDLAS
jgi:hypothetical protein